MSHEDYEIALYTIANILTNQTLPLEHRMRYVNNITGLDLTNEEAIKLCEYIDGVNSDFNILCNQCRTNVKKSLVK